MGLDEGLQRAADELEIRNLLAQLAQLADDGDLEQYIRLFISAPPPDEKKGSQMPDSVARRPVRDAGTHGNGVVADEGRAD